MIGSIDIKTRPLKLAFLVDPSNSQQVREAIRLASTLWGGVYFPIIPLHARMPTTWRDKPIKAPPAKQVILGYIEAYDPDVLVQCSTALPAYIAETGLQIIKPDEIWNTLDDDRSFSPKFGLGIFEILGEIFEQNFKIKAKYPLSVVVPRIPSRQSLFWASLYGEFPERHASIIQRHYSEPLEIQASTRGRTISPSFWRLERSFHDDWWRTVSLPNTGRPTVEVPPPSFSMGPRSRTLSIFGISAPSDGP